ncbi:MAG: translocation/assembly module TamB domain-containing protein [Deltaproteobacteria bacterium]|nr:translocation/assembly module TamB domain-containing protein [Deltaproteobacteria bacterium]
MNRNRISENQKTKVAKRIAKILLVLVLLMGLLAAGALFFVTSESGGRWISRKLHDGVKQQTNLEVVFRKVDLEFFPPRLLLEDLTIRGVDLDVGCTVEEAEVSPSALDLLAGRISIEEIYMGGPKCRVALTRTDMAKLRQASRIGDDTSDSIDLSFLPRFDVVALSSGQFELYVDDPEETGDLNVVITGLYLDITGRHRGQEQIEIRGLLEKAAANYKKGDIALEEQLRGLKLRAALDEDLLNIRTLSGRIAEVVIDARNVFVPMNLMQNKLDAAYLSVDVPLRRLSRFPLSLPEMKGHAGFGGHVVVQLDKTGGPVIEARGEVSLRNVTIDEFVIGDLDGAIKLDKEKVSWSDVELRTAGGALRLTGEMALDEDLTVHSDVELNKIELARLLENLTVPDSYVMQQMSGKATVTGKLNGLHLRGTTNLTVRNHMVFDDGFRKAHKETVLSLPEATVQGPFTITEKSFVGTGFMVHRNNSKINVDMEFAFNNEAGWMLHAKSSQMDLGDVVEIAGFAVSGVGRLDCKIDAPGYGAPLIDGSVDFTDMSFWGFDYRHVSSKVRFDTEVLSFEDLDVHSRKSHYSTKRLALDFYSPYGLGVSTVFDVERAELDDLARSYHLDTSGWGSPSGYVSGTVDIRYQTQPENLRVETGFSHEGLTLFNEVFGPGAVNALYDNEILTVNRFDMKKGKGTVALTGTLGASDELNFTGMVTDVQVEDIVYPPVSDLELNGLGQVFVVLEGTASHPRGRATLRMTDMSRREMKFGASDLEVSLEDDVLEVYGTLADRTVVLEHSVFDFRKKRFSLEAFFTDLKVAEILGLRVPGQNLWLTTTGEIAVNGRMSQNPRLNGGARIFNVEGGWNRFELKNKAPFDLKLENSRVTLENSRFLGRNVVFDLSGFAEKDRFKLTLHGLANLRLAKQLTDTISSSSGTLSFNLIVSGPYDSPKVRGEAEIREGEFIVADFPHPITDVNGRIELGSNMIRIEEFFGKTAGGNLDMSGWLSLNGLSLQDYRFNLNAANLNLLLMDDLVLRASTRDEGLIMMPGKERDIPMITGNLEISNFKYTAPVHIIDISDIDVAGIGDKRKRTTRPRLFDKSKDAFEYDVYLHGERNLVILNNLLDARFKIDDQEEPLRLVGTNQNYGFLGRVVGVGGEVRFAGKTFEIQNAYVSFKNANRPENPNFRVTADVDVRDWRLTITAEGSVEEYEVRLSSQPFLSQEDIVMLLLTGMTKQEHTAMNSQGLAMSLLPLLENAGSGTIPLEVNVYSEYSEKEEAETTRVALGKRITKDIWVRVSSSVGQEQDVEGTLSYKVNDNVSVSASYDNKNETSKTGNWGLDLRFRLEF